MRYAAAMFYGGQLVDAADADYTDFKRLGLLCPECKEPVHLVAASRRYQGSQLTEIASHFKHFKTKDPALARQCELRVAQITPIEIQRRASQARNQRLRLLQRRFWAILTNYYEQKLNFPINRILDSDGQQQFIKEMGNLFAELFLSENIEKSKELVKTMIQAGCNNTHVMFSYKPELGSGISASTEIQSHFRKVVSGNFDQQMQMLIATEVLDFLSSKSSRPLIEKLFTLATCVIFDAMGDGALLGSIGVDGNEVVIQTAQGKRVRTEFWSIPKNREIFYYYASGHFCLWLGMLPWASEMQ